MAQGKAKWIKAPKIKKLLSDDGPLSDGFLTRDKTLTVSGVGQPGSKVVLFDKGEKIGVATVGNDGKWSIDTAQLGDGGHRFTAKAKFGGLNGKVSKPVKGEVDSTAPGTPSTPDLATASDTGASSVDDHTADRTPTLTGTAEAGATVTIKDGATVLGTTVANGAGQWSFTAPALSDGLHAFRAIATDKAGNDSTASSPLAVTIDATKPGAPSRPDLAGASDSGASSSDNLTNDRTPTLTGTAEAGATVTIKDGAAILGTVVANSAGRWSFTAAALADGAHSIAAMATDKAGNASPLSAALVVRIDTAKSAGAIILDAVTADNIINAIEGDDCSGDIPIKGTVTGEIPDGTTVTLLVHDQTYTGTVIGGAFTIPVRPVHLTADSDLKITASVTVTDDAGNTATISDSHTYGLALIRPDAPVITGFSEDTGTVGDSRTGDTEITVTGTAEPGATIFYESGTKTTTADEHGNWQYTSGPRSDGLNFYIVTQRDAVGNVSNPSDIAVIIDTQVTGTITLGPVTEDNIVNLFEGDPYCGGDIPITGTVTGEIPDGATVTLDVNGVTYTGTVASRAFSIDVRPVAQTDDGVDLSITASITVTDAAGNTGTITDTQTYTYDTTQPEIEITGFSEDTGTPGDHITSDNQPSFFGTADPGATIELRYSGALGLIGQGVADANGEWTIDTTVALLTGTWNIFANAYNEVGNPNSDTFGMTIIA